MTPAELSIAFFLQMLVIIAMCRGVGWLTRRYLGQPQVVGEIVAGVILGPSLFGLLAPEIQAAIFPADSRGVLFVVAQLGAGLFMFIVGLGFRTEHFRSNVKSAASVSLAGIAVPFVVAIALTPWLLGIPGLFMPEVTPFQATLFFAACIAITAFPVLARIIHDRGLDGTRLGALVLSAGAIDDAAAWTLLAIVLASFGDGAGVAVKAVAGGAAFVAFALVLGPRLLAPLARIAEREGRINPNVMAVTMMVFMASAFTMDWAGLHAVFGGFIAGVVMPRGLFAEQLKRHLEPFALIVLLPAFFTYSGLHTQLSLVADPGLLAATLVILAASILAKGGACWGAARLTGQDNATALGIGALMNARGLMELIIINIGLQRGIIGPALFSILVVMTIVTTLMASPLFEIFYGRKARERGELGAIEDAPPLAREPAPSAK